MREKIIQFVTGTTEQIENFCGKSPSKQQRLILDTKKRQAFWDYNNVRYALGAKEIADWNQQDRQSPAYIANKPVIPSDVSQLADTQQLLPVLQDQLITPPALLYTTKVSRIPSGVLTPQGKFYMLQGDSVTAVTDVSITLDLTRYYAYENKNTPQDGWKLVYR